MNMQQFALAMRAERDAVFHTVSVIFDRVLAHRKSAVFAIVRLPAR